MLCLYNSGGMLERFIRQFCQQYTRNVPKTFMNSVKTVECEVEKLQELAEAAGDHRYTETLAKKKSALTELLGVSAQGALIRSGFCFDASFFGLESQNGQRRLVHSFKPDTGQVLTDHAAVCEDAVSVYSSLFQCEHREKQAASQGFYYGLSQVQYQSRIDLEAALSSEELFDALQAMQSGKASTIHG